MMFADAQTSAEASAEGGFQTTDGAVRLLEDGLFQGPEQNFQSAPGGDATMQSINGATIGPDGITFTPPSAPGIGTESFNLGADGALGQLTKIPGLENLGATMSSAISMPGGAGLLISLFQFLGSLFGAMAQAFASSAAEIARNYAVAAQSAMDMAKMMRSK